MSQKKWFLDLSVYLAWFPIVALLFWIILQLHTAIEIGLSIIAVHSNKAFFRIADVIDKYSYAILICAWIVVIIIIEGHLRNGITKHILLKRFARIFGPAALLLFIIDIFNLRMLEMATAGWLRWLALGAEFLIGGVITYYGFVRLGRKREAEPLQS